jgi:hypothetical protein
VIPDRAPADGLVGEFGLIPARGYARVLLSVVYGSAGNGSPVQPGRPNAPVPASFREDEWNSQKLDYV